MIKVAVPITGNEEFKALKKVIFSGKFVSGNNVEKFEKEYAKFIGTKYAVAVNSGTAALHASLASLDLKKDDEVIVPSISFVSSATAILHQGCIPIFCDSSSYTCNGCLYRIVHIIHCMCHTQT